MSKDQTTKQLTNDLAVLRCTVGNRQWLLGDDGEIDAAFATLSRKMHEMTQRLLVAGQDDG